MLRLLRALPLLAILLAITSPLFAIGFPGANDSMFPAAPKAKPAIDFDNRGFLIHGKRTFIVAGDVHYSRIPRALWRDRLLRIKRAGYNTIQTYTFWSYHETREGVWDFSGDKDLNAYLKLIQELGMYAIVRVGPYVNAEWESGGWPVWLRFKPGLFVRDDNPLYYHYMDRWLDHLMPIVASNQISRGGSVIMVQLENEDTRGSGTDLPNTYFQHLRDKCVALGLEVPYFFSGLNHGDDPIGFAPIDSTTRTSPWYSSEFWTGWIRFYGDDPDRAARRARASWKVIAYGGAGYTHYTIAGGTDFDNWSCDQQGVSYDFGAPIGQAGDLRDFYFLVKRPALFATSFSEILANSENASAQYQGFAAGVQVEARKSQAGTILFLDNPGGGAFTTQVKGDDGILYPKDGPLNVGPGEIIPIVEHLPIASGIVMTLAASRILGKTTEGNTTTIVTYGSPGEAAELHFATSKEKARISPGLTAFPNGVILKTKFPTDGYQDYLFQAGSHSVRIITESTAMADRTWFVTVGGVHSVVLGPAYVGDISLAHGIAHMTAESHRLGTVASQNFVLLQGAAPALKIEETPESHASHTPVSLPALSAWTTARGDSESDPTYNDFFWKRSDAPLPMGGDGSESAFAWYRTTVLAPHAGDYTLALADAGDRVSVFVNGVHSDTSAIRQRFRNPVPNYLKVTLHQGDNQLAFFTAHYGREKLHAYVGPIDTLDRKGISGPVALADTPGSSLPVSQWQFKRDDRGESSATEMASPDLKTDGGDWRTVSTGDEVFNYQVGFGWYRTTLSNVPGNSRTLHFDTVDDNAVVYLNGVRVMANNGVNNSFDAPLDGAWKENGPNIVAVLVENTGGPGGIFGTVVLQSGAEGLHAPILGWKMRGGIDLPSSKAWKPLTTMALPGTPGTGIPTFYQTHFTFAPPARIGPHPIYRVAPLGLSHGSIWLNGHNLGRYPELSPINGLYMPENWLLPTGNTLVIFDEEGNAPTQVTLSEEEVASREGLELVTTQPVATTVPTR